MSKKKKKLNYPRRKRFKKDQRLHNAKTKWLPTATAKNLPKSYGKWYGVDLISAINELEILGYQYSVEYKKQVNSSIENKAKEKRRRKEQRELADDFAFDQDETFAFIAGYTSGRVPFGITYEEEEELNSKTVSACDFDKKTE